MRHGHESYARLPRFGIGHDDARLTDAPALGSAAHWTAELDANGTQGKQGAVARGASA
jgi:hypothetical protein